VADRAVTMHLIHVIAVPESHCAVTGGELHGIRDAGCKSSACENCDHYDGNKKFFHQDFTSLITGLFSTRRFKKTKSRMRFLL
jgi:hypothetical protein